MMASQGFLLNASPKKEADNKVMEQALPLNEADDKAPEKRPEPAESSDVAPNHIDHHGIPTLPNGEIDMADEPNMNEFEVLFGVSNDVHHEAFVCPVADDESDLLTMSEELEPFPFAMDYEMTDMMISLSICRKADMVPPSSPLFFDMVP